MWRTPRREMGGRSADGTSMEIDSPGSLTPLLNYSVSAPCTQSTAMFVADVCTTANIQYTLAQSVSN